MTEPQVVQAPEKRPLWVTVAGSAVTFGLLIGIVLVLWSMFHPYNFHGIVMQSPMKAINFTLTGHNGQPVSLNDYQGQVILLYFGYTTCPDVCPTTLADLHVARAALGNRADQVQVMMITIDPERDTQAVLAEYMPHFDSSFIGLTGTSDQIAEVATYYGIYFAKQAGNATVGYLVDHTSTVMAIDKEGYLRVVFPFGTTSDDMRADLEYLLSR